MNHRTAFSELLNATAQADANTVIATLAELSLMQPAFLRLRIEWVGRSIAAQACPAELADGSIAVFCSCDREGTDVHASVCEAAKAHNQGRAVPTRLLSGILLLTLVRERVDGSHLKLSGREQGYDRSDTSRAFRDIIAWAVRKGCSDVHLNIDFDAAESQVMAHVDGHYVAPAHLRMPTERLLEIVRVAWQDGYGGRESVFDARSESQCRLYDVVDAKPYMLRWGQFVADKGPSVTLRLLSLAQDEPNANLEALGYLPSQVAMLERAMLSEGGAIVFGGVVGSGKSTSLARLLGSLPNTRKIMTIEDPVERVITNALQASIVRSFDGSEEASSFRAKLMMLKRAAVSDVLLGEIRDTETGRAFLDIVESGTNLYTTVHVSSVCAIPSRLASPQVQVPVEVLASPGMLKLLAYQALLPKLCTACSLPLSVLMYGAPDALGRTRDATHWANYIERLRRLYSDLNKVRVRNSQGCAQCRLKELPEIYGYAGRTAVAELYELGHDAEALALVCRHDVQGLAKRYRSRSDGDPFSADMAGKTAMQCAVHKMLHGELDPRDIEPRFMAFETVESLTARPI
ncbi:Flp pilus assembly complex ATPase component TadA [Pusillimonas sp. CC-YST705]|uniref:Flp pilus assembly complex ATPase component TadA n=1 Tax=Mesopusillimonas faecipullorum TaxID=2755040 RepID=A0ABS8CAA8_9BURK|nr:ATPase, T2SS/T4P/T4SS family [Mesopusillimonas faecipullorum]MCB5362923.1 Flp pilus assembly complex ATPase component TadA [Mesopusillimonas faecipullorum]